VSALLVATVVAAAAAAIAVIAAPASASAAPASAASAATAANVLPPVVAPAAAATAPLALLALLAALLVVVLLLHDPNIAPRRQCGDRRASAAPRGDGRAGQMARLPSRRSAASARHTMPPLPCREPDAASYERL
jgi:hypothetical protein